MNLTRFLKISRNVKLIDNWLFLNGATIKCWNSHASAIYTWLLINVNCAIVWKVVVVKRAHLLSQTQTHAHCSCIYRKQFEKEGRRIKQLLLKPVITGMLSQKNTVLHVIIKHICFTSTFLYANPAKNTVATILRHACECTLILLHVTQCQLFQKWPGIFPEVPQNCLWKKAPMCFLKPKTTSL